jgi:fructokinase
MSVAKPIFGSVEAGGTKFVVALGRGPDDIIETARVDTTTPQETLSTTINWLRDAAKRHGKLAAIGIASFGPAELDRASPHWGAITNTPKPGWANTHIARHMHDALGVPVAFDTDVNGAALAESRWGAGRGHKICVYVTIGTGIGGGVMVDGKVLHGLSHPEMGHMRVARHTDDQIFAGICPKHGDCLEGLASGPAIKARWGASLSQLPSDHPAQTIIAYYLAQLVVNLQAMMEPSCIILGGGVTATSGLLARIRTEALRLGAGYFRGNPLDMVVAPGLGDKSGLLGGLALAMDALVSGEHEPI